MLNFAIRTAASNQSLVLGGDGTFSSLALYIYNSEDGYCEYAELIPDFTPAVQEYTRSVLVSSREKTIYAIANYLDIQKNFSAPLTEQTSMQELETITVLNDGFADTNILMVGKQQVVMDSQTVSVEIPMQRMVARLDIYTFKSEELANKDMIIKSVEFNNQVLNSDIRYKSYDMVVPVAEQTVSTNITENNILGVAPDELSMITFDNRNASFYSYQNISESLRPEININPYLRITAEVDGTDITYIGYIESFTQPEGRFSLIRNKVYHIVAVLGADDANITLRTTVLPWEVVPSEIGHVVLEADYTFDAWGGDSEALRGIIQYPYADSEGPHNKTSYANYSFTLSTPAGAVWVATITNGLDFAFGKGGTTEGKNAVSQGIARTEPYEIKVGATKPWSGTERKTYLYITVDGVKLKINPQISGSRKFPGTDTDILISQTEYQE